MVLKISQNSDTFLDKIYKESMMELDTFFNLNWTKNTPKLVIFEDRRTLDELLGKKTEKWVVGSADRGILYLLERKNFEKESGHKYSDENYKQLLKHELTHLFLEVFSEGKQIPIWFNEGMAVFLSEQYKQKEFKGFSKLLEYYTLFGQEVYNEGGYAINFLVKKFGQEKLQNLIKDLDKITKKEKFDQRFEEIYGSKPTYEFFNSLIE